MRTIKQYLIDVPHLMTEWDYELNSENGLFADKLAAQSNQYAYWKCRLGHRWKAKINNRYNGRGCPECRKHLKTSFPEQATFFYLKQLFPDSINSFKDIFEDQMELDVYVPSLRVGIEYDGIAWHKDVSSLKEKKKYEICQQNAITLYRLKECVPSSEFSESFADVVLPVEIFQTGAKKSFAHLDNAIRLLISHLSQKHVDVNTKRDRLLIFECYHSAFIEHSLLNAYPDVAKEWHPTKNGALTPSMFPPHSSAKVWWFGVCGHEWEAAITVRTRGNSCPFCAGQEVLKGFNDLQTVFPQIAKQWHPTLNGSKTPDSVTYGSGYSAYWLCPTCKQAWRTKINMRTSGNRGCPFCAHIKPISGQNDLLTLHPDLMKEWDYEKNKGINPAELLELSNKKAWWKCSKCKYEYQAQISNRVKGTGCKRCAGQIVIPGKNDFETLCPEAAKEWNYSKNDTIPSLVISHSNKKYHWICSLGHEWKTSPNTRMRGRGCPVCSGNQVLQGFNDIVTTHPDIAAEWHPTKNNGLLPTQVSKGYKRKVWFLCNSCKNDYDSYISNKIKGYGKCPYCSSRKNRTTEIIQVETGKHFKTLKEAAASLGKKDPTLIQMCCNGKCETGYGFHWKYISRKFSDTRLESAHGHSSNNRQEIEGGEKCGCFYCLCVFDKSDITDWVDGGTTALCPFCGIDSVLSDESGFPITKEFLKEMKDHWF